MEEQNKQLRSIWGSWWEPIRKWFYTTWMLYELSIRFYDYSFDFYQYFEKQLHTIIPHIGSIGTQVLNLFCSSAIFTICSVFLTIPACFVLYQFFKEENLTRTRLEARMKLIF